MALVTDLDFGASASFHTPYHTDAAVHMCRKIRVWYGLHNGRVDEVNRT